MTDKEKERAQRFGAYIRNLRIARGMTQQELADRCGYSHRATVSAVEKGKNDIAFDKLPALSAALGVDAKELFNAYDFERAGTTATAPQIDAIKSMLTDLTPSQLDQVTAIIKVMRDQNKGGAV